jgi:hypothetical protein
MIQMGKEKRLTLTEDWGLWSKYPIYTVAEYTGTVLVPPTNPAVKLSLEAQTFRTGKFLLRTKSKSEAEKLIESMKKFYGMK